VPTDFPQVHLLSEEELPEAASGGANTPPEAIEKKDFPGGGA